MHILIDDPSWQDGYRQRLVDIATRCLTGEAYDRRRYHWEHRYGVIATHLGGDVPNCYSCRARSSGCVVVAGDDRAVVMTVPLMRADVTCAGIAEHCVGEDARWLWDGRTSARDDRAWRALIEAYWRHVRTAAPGEWTEVPDLEARRWAEAERRALARASASEKDQEQIPEIDAHGDVMVDVATARSVGLCDVGIRRWISDHFYDMNPDSARLSVRAVHATACRTGRDLADVRRVIRRAIEDHEARRSGRGGRDE